MVLTTPSVNPELSSDGTHILYENREGYASSLRKHHTSSIARDILFGITLDGPSSKSVLVVLLGAIPTSTT